MADPEGLTAFISLSHLDQETEPSLAKLKITKRSSVGSSLKFLAIARGDARCLSAFRPYHGVGYRGWTSRARGRGRNGRYTQR